MEKERSISATYYILQGKPSIQTIQDGQIYELNKYFGIYKQLSKERYFLIIDDLVNDRYIKKQEKNNFYTVTDDGKQFIDEQFIHSNDLQGSLYKNIDMIFFERLLLFVQVFANRKMNHTHYIPIIDNREIENWVKQYYSKWKSKSNQVIETLYDEFVRILSPLDDKYAEIFVEQLSSHKRIGLTIEQIAVRLKMSVESVFILHINTIHYLLQQIQTEPKLYPLLHTISHDLFQQSALTKSAKVTKNLMNQGCTLEEIAHRRRLQINTIYDHVVEIAMTERNFSIVPFVSDHTQQEILQAIKKLNSYKLKDIKNIVHEDISYFQIRLVIAKLKEYR